MYCGLARCFKSFRSLHILFSRMDIFTAVLMPLTVELVEYLTVLFQTKIKGRIRDSEMKNSYKRYVEQHNFFLALSGFFLSLY